MVYGILSLSPTNLKLFCSPTNLKLFCSKHRVAFLDALIDHVDPKLVHFNKRFKTVTQSVSQPGQQVVHFTDGTSAEADVVLLASGIRGAGRDLVTGHDPKQDVAYANVEYYRALAPAGPAKLAGLKTDVLKRTCIFTGKNKVKFLP